MWLEKNSSKEKKMDEILEKLEIGGRSVGVGCIYEGGWNWLHPAIGHIKGTAGTLDKWVIGYERTYRPFNGDSEEIFFEWQGQFVTQEEAENWLNS